MQLNGTTATAVIANSTNITPTSTTMAASEPPEPPPRNPDKINASLKHIGSTTSTESVSGHLRMQLPAFALHNK